MIINSVKCTATATEWTQQLKNAYPNEMKNSTRFSIYMNPQGGLKAFSSPQSAQNENYRIVLTTEQMITFTQTFFDQLGNGEGGFSVQELMTLNHVFKKMSEIERNNSWFKSLSPTVAKINGLSKFISDKLDTCCNREIVNLNNNYTQIFNQLQGVFQKHFRNEKESVIQILNKYKNEWRAFYNNNNPKTDEEWENRVNSLNSCILALQKRCETFELICEVSTQIDRWVQFKAKAEQFRYSGINMLGDLDNSGSVEISEAVSEEPDFAWQLQSIKKQIFSIFQVHDDDKYQEELNQILASTNLDSLKSKFNLTKAEMDEIVTESNNDITQTQASFQVSFNAAAQNNSIYNSINQSIHNKTNQSFRDAPSHNIPNINNSSLYIRDPSKYSSILKAKGKNNDLF